MPVRARVMEETPPQEELHLMLVGPEGSGKSRLAATGRGAKLFLDPDRRAGSLAGFKDIYALTFEDSQGIGIMPTGFSEMLDVVAVLESTRQLNKIPIFGQLRSDITIKTVVVDSLYTTAMMARNFALYSNSELRRSINIGGKSQINIPKSWDGWNAEVAMVEQMILRLFAIKNLDVIVISHETDEERPESTSEKPAFTGGKCIFPVRYHVIQKYFNDIWRVTRLNSKTPTVEIIPNYQFSGLKSSFSFDKFPVADAVAGPNIERAIRDEQLKAGVATQKS